MKHIFLFLFLLFSLKGFAVQKHIDVLSVGDNRTTISASSSFSVFSTTKGSQPCPSMTTAQKNSLAVSQGLCVYDTDIKGLFIYSGSSWSAAAQDLSPYAKLDDVTQTVTASAL